MRDEALFQMAVQVACAKLQSHFISPATVGVDDWLEEQVLQEWNRLRRLWESGCREDSDAHPA